MERQCMFCAYSTFIDTSVFFFNDPATTEIYTLSLHDALPIFRLELTFDKLEDLHVALGALLDCCGEDKDRKSTRLNSSHVEISYAVFCLKKKKTKYMRKNSVAVITSPRKSHYSASSDHSSYST